jgi:hypothetical protein
MPDIQFVSNGEIVPDLMRRSCGGWLAVAPNGAKFSIGVTAATAEEAREKFCSVVRRWLEILASGEKSGYQDCHRIA